MIFHRLRDYYRKHERWTPTVFFVLGFAFDAMVLKRADELKVIVQQAVYLVIAGALISAELIETQRELSPPSWMARPWRHREPFLHFLLGTLLNSYAIFYFKSASALTSFLFIGILAALLTINEFKRFEKSQVQVHVAMWTLCLVSYFISLVPILLGFIGRVPFLVAIAVSLAICFGIYKLLQPKLTKDGALVRTHLVLPFVSVPALFVLLYFAHAIPPVPLSMSYMGIFHEVQKVEGEYQLSFSRSRWKFWQSGDQTFSARPGDVIHCFVRVYSPTSFSDQLQVRWLYYDPRQGWLSSDAIPLQVTGGREEGYRAVTQKTNYQVGDWRVQVETREGQEVGRIRLTVKHDEATDERTLTTITQ